jgi:long-chain acyl-CoA synthetase
MAEARETVPKRIKTVAEQYPNEDALLSKDADGVFQVTTYGELYQLARSFGAGLLDLGIRRGDHIGIISDNRLEWMIADLGILGIGAVDVPRGSDSTVGEIAYILGHADCPATLAENETQLRKIQENSGDLPKLERIIVMDPAYEPKDDKAPFEVIPFQAVVDRGKTLLASDADVFERELETGDTDDIATLIYTSGTTGEPKGVMLAHRSFLFQMDRIHTAISLTPEDLFISVLPIWHSFERAVEYVVLNRAAAIAYSKPVGKIMLDDMQKLKPTWMASVPRIWEGVRSAVYRNINSEGGAKKALFYAFVAIGQAHAFLRTMFRGLLPQFHKRTRIVDAAVSFLPLLLLTPFKLLGDVLVFGKLRARLGGRFKAGVSGGGALPSYVDRFFQAAGILLLEGYGLTETGPILSVRKQHAPVPGTVGPLLPDIEHRVLGEDMSLKPPGEKGVLYVKSEQVMEGYYKRPEATAQVLSEGWLNTGDVAVFTHGGAFTILGRAKDTIVLMGGENVEPTPIEEKLVQSEYIEQAMVVGQDQKFLGALIVPNMEMVESYANGRGTSYIEAAELLERPEIQDLVHDEIQALINPKNGFKAFERIFRFTLIPKPFEVGRELTHTLKKRRNVVDELYAREIRDLFR